MKYLGYSDKAKTIIEKLACENSPFDNAEVLNSELGSRLFRSFVEVNPVAVSQNLTRVFSNKSKDKLRSVETFAKPFEIDSKPFEVRNLY